MTAVGLLRRIVHGDQTCRTDGCDRWAGPHHILCPACQPTTPTDQPTTHRAKARNR